MLSSEVEERIHGNIFFYFASNFMNSPYHLIFPSSFSICYIRACCYGDDRGSIDSPAWTIFQTTKHLSLPWKKYIPVSDIPCICILRNKSRFHMLYLPMKWAILSGKFLYKILGTFGENGSIGKYSGLHSA